MIVSSLFIIILSSTLLCAAVSAFTTSHLHRHRKLSGRDGAATKESSSSIMMSSSLADEYAIRTQSDRSNELRWDFIPINHFEEDQNSLSAGVGTLALKALESCSRHIAQQERDALTSHSLQCEWTKSSTNVWSINVDRSAQEINNDGAFPNELDCVLSRIMVQCAISKIKATNSDGEEGGQKGGEEILLHVTLPLPEGRGCQQISLSHKNYNDCVRHLFTPLNSEYAQMELVDMVNNNGDVLGSLPRPYVHTYNILHRGIGMIVTKNKSIFDTNNNNNDSGGNSTPPDVYVHQRTSTKRVFPSLYDMFVGGVSTSGEDATWTAAREVAEELGLKRALTVLEEGGDNTSLDNPLSDELFQCTICTSYNRCVVSMFAYTCDTSSETIEWQEEEVAWGGWVPYDVVEVAGKLSIDRLKERGVWPGTGEDDNDDERVANDEIEAKVKELKIKNNNDEQEEQPWESWDFVPDGLLVWVAWVKWVNENAEIFK